VKQKRKSSSGIDARAINGYLEYHGLDQRVKIFFADNAGEHKSHDLEEFITQLNILHLLSIAGSQYQNALAEHAGGWRLGSAPRCGNRIFCAASGRWSRSLPR
jgi:hypothetical protein